MTTNHMKLVRAWAIARKCVISLGQIFYDQREANRIASHKAWLAGEPVEDYQVLPVTITSAEWQSVHDYVRGLGEDDGSSKPCWFIANERQWFGDYWRGIFSGMDLSTGENVSLPDTHLSITHVLPIHPPQSPSED